MTAGSRVNARLEHLFLAFENYCVKVHTDRPIAGFRAPNITAQNSHLRSFKVTCFEVSGKE